jgi:hypothetical protein
MKMVLKSQIVYLSLYYENNVSNLVKYIFKTDGYWYDSMFHIYIP